MHAHAGAFSTNSIYCIVTSPRLEFDTDVPPIAVLAQTEILGNLSNLLLVIAWSLVRSSTTAGTTSRSSSTTLVTATSTGTLIGVLDLYLFGLNWLGVLFQLLPGGRYKVDI